jgi:hypothetical protein
MATQPANPKTLKQLREEAKQRQPATSQIRESAQAALPPALERIKNAIGVRFAQGQRLAGPGGTEAIASVAEHEPHLIEINDPARFRQGPLQTEGHEIVHLWRANLPGPIQAAGLPDNPAHPYDISDLEALRAKGYTLATIPQEQAAAAIQRYIADPASRKRLQPWVDDLNRTPLSLMNPTSPAQKGINVTPRPPAPPVEAWTTLLGLRQQAARKKP